MDDIDAFDDRPFRPGKAVAAIEAINGPEERNIARGEYCYFSGQTEKMVEIIRPYLVETLNKSSAAHGVSFAPTVQFEKLEIHTVFLRFQTFIWSKISRHPLLSI